MWPLREAYGAFSNMASDKERQSRVLEKCRALTQLTLLLLPSYERNLQNVSATLKGEILLDKKSK